MVQERSRENPEAGLRLSRRLSDNGRSCYTGRIFEPVVLGSNIEVIPLEASVLAAILFGK